MDSHVYTGGIKNNLQALRKLTVQKCSLNCLFFNPDSQNDLSILKCTWLYKGIYREYTPNNPHKQSPV